MSIVMPILFFALAMGLIFKRMGTREWLILATWVAIVIFRFWIKGPS